MEGEGPTLMISMNLSDIAILNIKGYHYRCIINGFSRSKAMNLMQNTDLTKKAEHYKIEKFAIIFLNR